ncbi:hypothetical protein PENTCL1PPCAC_5718, partial [Pristionchus entomophagus]
QMKSSTRPSILYVALLFSLAPLALSQESMTLSEIVNSYHFTLEVIRVLAVVFVLLVCCCFCFKERACKQSTNTQREILEQQFIEGQQ